MYFRWINWIKGNQGDQELVIILRWHNSCICKQLIISIIMVNLFWIFIVFNNNFRLVSDAFLLHSIVSWTTQEPLNLIEYLLDDAVILNDLNNSESLKTTKSTFKWTTYNYFKQHKINTEMDNIKSANK